MKLVSKVIVYIKDVLEHLRGKKRYSWRQKESRLSLWFNKYCRPEQIIYTKYVENKQCDAPYCNFKHTCVGSADCVKRCKHCCGQNIKIFKLNTGTMIRYNICCKSKYNMFNIFLLVQRLVYLICGKKEKTELITF